MKLAEAPQKCRVGDPVVGFMAVNSPKAEPASENPSDPDLLRQLVEDHGDSVYRLALSVARDRALAEDIAQEAMVKAWLALPSFRGDGSMRGWLLRITHNTAISVLRSRKAIVTDPTLINDISSTYPPPKSDSVESKVMAKETVAQFVQSLDLLDDLSRSIVVLRELEGLSYDEISEILDVPLPTVKTRLLRARRRLSTALREWG